MIIATELSPPLTPSKDDNLPNELDFEAPPQPSAHPTLAWLPNSFYNEKKQTE